MRKLLQVVGTVAVLVLALVVAPADAYTNCSGSVNPNPVNRDAPVFVKAVTNGKRFIAGKGNDTFHVLHVWGSHYEMGFAQGQLMAEYYAPLWTQFMAYAEGQVSGKVGKYLPQWLIDLVTTIGLPLALDYVAKLTAPFTPSKYIDEMRGIADGANFDFDKVYQLNMFPELIKAACTIVGATKSATTNGQIAHLRGLDFSVHIPIVEWPTVTVLHGDGTEAKVANFGWIGLVGSLTGISSAPLGIGEKVWLDHKKGVSTFNGEPWMFLLRDVLYMDDINTAIAHLNNTARTCAIHVGLGDGIHNEFRGIKMAHDGFVVDNWQSIDYPEHPIIKDIMYWDKHMQPTHSWCLSTLLKGYAGNITAEKLAVEISSIAQTGDCHSVAFDYAGMQAYVANARKANATDGPLPAYGRQYTWLNITALFAETL